MPAPPATWQCARRVFAGVLSLMIFAAAVPPAEAAPPTARQRAQVRSAELRLRRAGNLFRSKRFAAAAKLVEEVQDTLASLAADPSEKLSELTTPLEERVVRARALLKQQGIEITPPDDDAVSFANQVAPLLLAKCGGCHVQRSRGELSMATYEALAKGSAGGVVFVAGDSQGSRMIELVAGGEMPRGGGKVTPAELALLARWIDQGARFDGQDAATPLANLTPATEDRPSEGLTMKQATGREEVQFARDLGQIFADNCLECHGRRNPRNNFSLATFNRLLRGGDAGSVLDADEPAESLLVKKLRGQADGERMPLNRPPLADEVIAKIEKWIALGAPFDGGDSDTPLEETIARVFAQQATHDQLSKARAELAEKNWRLISPDAESQREETTGVLVYGNVAAELLAEVARTADEQMARLAKLFEHPPAEPLIKGRITLYVFDKRYDYGEVGIMLERREIPIAWRGHWRYTVIDAYGCILLDGREVPPGRVAQQIAGAYIAGLGDAPRWFAEGSARAIAARVDPRNDQVRSWDDEARRVVESAATPEAFLSGELAPEDTDVLSYSFVDYLMSNTKRYTGLVAAVREGTPFDEAFESAYRATPAEVAATWKTRVAGARRRK